MPGNRYYIACGGGLGDLLNNYLSTGTSGMPSTDYIKSIWMHRIDSLRLKYPDLYVAVVMVNHNPEARELLLYDKSYNDIYQFPYAIENPKSYKHFLSSRNDMSDITLLADWLGYPARTPQIFLSREDAELVGSISKPYIVIHPFARKSTREIFLYENCRYIVDRIANSGINAVVVGKSYSLTLEGSSGTVTETFNYERDRLFNLVNRASIRTAAYLTMHADGFIGNHSCMTQAAWSRSVRSVCVLPAADKHERKFFEGDHPVCWGLNKNFTRKLYVDTPIHIDRDILGFFSI